MLLTRAEPLLFSQVSFLHFHRASACQNHVNEVNPVQERTRYRLHRKSWESESSPGSGPGPSLNVPSSGLLNATVTTSNTSMLMEAIIWVSSKAAA